MEIEQYLQRIGYRGSLKPDLPTLRGLHLAHIMSVPFENLDIHAGREIVIDEASFFHKVVHERRGGFCYELNGLFGALLRQLGFEVELISARVANPRGGYGPEFDHLALMVRLEERWLADIGFGDSFREPLRLDFSGVQPDGGRAYRITDTDGLRSLWQQRPGGEWVEKYVFTLTPRRLEDFAAMCRYHQTSPESGFTQGPVCTLPRPDGRITLGKLLLVETSQDWRSEQALTGPEQYFAHLRDLFGVELPPALQTTLAGKLSGQ